MSKITNLNALGEGFHVGSQSPIDDRVVFEDITDLAALGGGDQEAYRYYEGMRVWLLSTNKEYVWREKVGSEVGAIADFTYPASVSASGINYGTRTFNFFETGFVGVSTISSVYTVEAQAILFAVPLVITVPDCQRILSVTLYNNATREDITDGMEIIRNATDQVTISTNVSLTIDIEIIYKTL